MIAAPPACRLDGLVAVLDPAGWWLLGERTPLAPGSWPTSTPAELLHTAALLDFRQVWIYPGTGLDGADWSTVPGWNTRPAVGAGPPWIWANREVGRACHGGGRSSRLVQAVEVAYLDPDPRRCAWAGLEPPELLDQLDAFGNALGARWSCSGAITSDRWLRAHYRAPGGLRLASSAVVDVPISNRGPAAMRHWCRPPTGPERAAGRYVHAFDVNGMFLAAASSLALPVGEAEYSEHRRPEPKLPGWWLLEGAEHWIPSPTLELAMQRGRVEGPADVVAAWTWPEHHRWLEPWYRAIRHARATLEPGTVAAGALKAVYTAGVGRLGSLKRTNGAADPLYQPYWRHAVIAEANARLERKLHRARDAHGIHAIPVALDVDCGYWISPLGAPGDAANVIGIEVDAQLGHFRYAGTARLTARLLDALAGETWQALEALREAVN